MCTIPVCSELYMDEIDDQPIDLKNEYIVLDTVCAVSDTCSFMRGN